MLAVTVSGMRRPRLSAMVAAAAAGVDTPDPDRPRPAVPSPSHRMSDFPLLPVALTLGVQSLATMAVYAVPVLAPAVSADLGLPPSAVGYYTAILYAAGCVGSVVCVGFVLRHGAIRMSQVCLMVAPVGLVSAATGTTAGVVACAVAMGFAYALPLPTGSHLLIRAAPPRLRNVAFSVRQIGVPLGGIAIGSLAPSLALAFGWQTALVILILPFLLLLAVLQPFRARFDGDRDPARPISAGHGVATLGRIRRDREVRGLAVSGFFYAGAEVSYGVFLVACLSERVGFDLVAAGFGLAAFQGGGLAGRVVFGSVADRTSRPALLLGMIGVAICGTTFVAAGFSPSWSAAAIYAACFAAGTVGGGWTGVTFAEVARLGGPAEAAALTGMFTAVLFVGVILWPIAFAAIVGFAGYGVAYAGVACGALAGGLQLLLSRPPHRGASA